MSIFEAWKYIFYEKYLNNWKSDGEKQEQDNQEF